MKLKAPLIEIVEADPFAKDLLGRKKCANGLTELLRSTNDPLVMCINAPWGEGKTTFVNMWRQMLINEGFKTLYFNAWENDFSNDALVSIISELDIGIQKLSAQAGNPNQVNQKLKKVQKLGIKLVKKTIPTAIKIATAGIINVDDLTDEALADLSAKLAEEQIKQYENSKNSVLGFREELSSVASAISTDSGQGNKLPLVIIIDELDRCKPTYAINILESVKHFFSVDNIVFVLTIDKDQLSNSIKSMYGNGMDVEGYLRRFIDLDFNLPSPDRAKFCKAQFEAFGLKEWFDIRRQGRNQYDFSNVQDVFTALFESFDFTLREQERVFTQLSLAVRTTREGSPIYARLLAVLIIIKTKNNLLYKEFVNGLKSVEDVMNYIGSSKKGREFVDSHDGAVIESMLVSSRSGYRGAGEATENYQFIIDNAPHEEEKIRAKKIVDLLLSFEARNEYGILSQVVSKIDLVSNFD